MLWSLLQSFVVCVEEEVGWLAVSRQVVHSGDGSCVEIQAVGYHLNLVSTSGEEVVVRQESMARGHGHK